MKAFISLNNLALIIASLMLLVPLANAQSLEDLNTLSGHKVKAYYSNGAETQAEAMAARYDRVLAYYRSVLDFEPEVTLLVLSPADWSSYTGFPVYGMPHYTDAETLVVASEDNPFWQSFIPPLDALPTELASLISTTYVDDEGNLTMRPFFDLLAIHELGHAFHLQGGLTMQRKWMGELFANVLLHTYIAENEPDLLPALTVFPTMVVANTNKEELPYTTLDELESNYTLITQKYPNNYGWYQSRLHIAAQTIYDAANVLALKNLWFTLKTQEEPLDDADLTELLANSVHQSVADVLLHWDD